MYRPAPLVPGLPLPRARLSLFTAFPFIGGVVGALVAIVGFADGGLAAHWVAVKEGGAVMFVLLASAFVLPFVLAITGTALVRGKGVSAGALVAFAVAPVAVGTFFAFYQFTRVDAVLKSVEPASHARIKMLAAAEVSNVLTLSGLVAGATCMVMMLAAGGAVASIDRAKAPIFTPPSSSGLARRHWIPTLAFATAWVVGTLVLFAKFSSQRPLSGLSIVAILVVVIAASAAVVVVRRAGSLRDWHDAVEARTHGGLIVIAGASGIFAACIVERAELARETTLILSAVAGEPALKYYDPGALILASHSARLLALLAAARSHAICAVGVHVLLGGATFASALLPALGRRSDDKTVTPTGSGAPGALVAFLFVSLLLAGTARRQASLLTIANASKLDGAPLPLLDHGRTEPDEIAVQTLRIPANGSSTTFGEKLGPSARFDVDGPLLDIAADRDVTFDRVRKELLLDRERSIVYRRYRLLARHRGDGDGDWQRLGLGELSELVGRATIGLPFVLDSSGSTPASLVTIRLSDRNLYVTPPAQVTPTASTPLGWPLEPSGHAFRAHLTSDGVRLLIRPEERVSNVAAALDQIQHMYWMSFRETASQCRIAIAIEPAVVE
jgi:hypothetical protein